MDCRREKSPNCPPSQPTRSPGLNISKLTICAKHIPFIFFVQRISNETNLHKNELEKKRKRLKRKVWKRKINFRRKNFGNLDEWDPDPQMKKVENARMQSSCFDSFWEKWRRCCCGQGMDPCRKEISCGAECSKHSCIPPPPAQNPGLLVARHCNIAQKEDLVIRISEL